jgi:signal peptidase I
MLKFIRTPLNRWKTYKLELKARSKWLFFWVDTAETIIVAIGLALIIRQFLVQTSLVYSGSMIPTLQIGDRLFVNKVVYHIRDPKRGEIVLFKSPYKDGREFVKRLIGLPGETVEIRKGIVYINGSELNLAGVDIQRDYSFYGPEKIPSNSYFMLGDNRSNSADSRVWKYVPQSDLIGRAVITILPLNRMQFLR